MLEKTLVVSDYCSTTKLLCPRFLVCLLRCGDYALTTRNLNTHSTITVQVESGRLEPVHKNVVNGSDDAVTSGVKGIIPDSTSNSADRVVRHTNNLKAAVHEVARGTGAEPN